MQNWEKIEWVYFNVSVIYSNDLEATCMAVHVLSKFIDKKHLHITLHVKQHHIDGYFRLVAAYLGDNEEFVFWANHLTLIINGEISKKSNYLQAA